MLVVKVFCPNILESILLGGPFLFILPNHAGGILLTSFTGEAVSIKSEFRCPCWRVNKSPSFFEAEAIAMRYQDDVLAIN